MRHRYTELGPAVLAVVAAVVASLHAAAVPAPTDPTGRLAVELLTGETWAPMGVLCVGRFPRRFSLRLPGDSRPQPVSIRITNRGTTPAYLDQVKLGEVAPEGEDAALVAALDLDLLAVEEGRSARLTFPGRGDGTLEIVARAAPARIAAVPFAFPPANLFRSPAAFSSFYAYVLGARPPVVDVAGSADRPEAGTPLFSEPSRPGTGHPTAPTVGWVSNDGSTLFATIDFLSDNTDDGDDFAALLVRRREGVRVFSVSPTDRTWGRRRFTRTELGPYRHTVYQFAVPLSELSTPSPGAGDTLQLAFRAYGTSAVTPIIDFFDSPVGSQTVDSSGCTSSDNPVTSVLGGERDMRVLSGAPTATVNAGGSGLLQAIFPDTGAVELVFDGPDSDCSTVATGTLDVDFFAPGFDRIVLMGAANPGIAAVTVSMEIHTLVGGTYWSVNGTVPAGASPADVTFMLDATNFPGISLPTLDHVTAIVLTLSGEAGGGLAATALVPSLGPVPVELQSFGVDPSED